MGKDEMNFTKLPFMVQLVWTLAIFFGVMAFSWMACDMSERNAQMREEQSHQELKI